MRRGLLTRQPVDVVAALLQQGRLADIQMFHHFSTSDPNPPVPSPSGAVVDALRELETLCAAHAAQTVRYDALLLRNPATQRRLARIASCRLSVEALSAFVAPRALPAESAALALHSARALQLGAASAHAVLGPHSPLLHGRTRRLFPDGAPFAPFLRRPPTETPRGLLGASPLRMAAPHPNLRVCAAAVERDAAALLHGIRKETNRADALFAAAVSAYVAELLANMAVVYRCTAALARGEAEDWLLTYAFCAESGGRREEIMRQTALATATRKAMGKAEDINTASIHPVELMNAEPVKRVQSKATK